MARAGATGTERALRRRGTIARLGSRSYATYDVSPNILGTRQRRAAVWLGPACLPPGPANSRPAAIVPLPRNPGGVRVSGCRGASAELHTRWLINPANLECVYTPALITLCAQYILNPFAYGDLDRRHDAFSSFLMRETNR